MLIEYSLNPYFTNKLVKASFSKQEKAFEFYKWNKSFVKTKTNIEELFKSVSKGFSFGPIFCDEYYSQRSVHPFFRYKLCDFNKNEYHFLKSNLAIVDIDEGWAIEKLIKSNDPASAFNKKYLSILYPTFKFDPNSEEYKSRVRLIYILETPITDRDKYKQLLKGLSLSFNQQTHQATAADTCFFGNSNNSFVDNYGKVFNNKILPDNEVKTIINFWLNSAEYKKSIKPGKVYKSNRTKPVPTNHKIATLPDSLKMKYEVLLPNDVIDGQQVGTVQGCEVHRYEK